MADSFPLCFHGKQYPLFVFLNLKRILKVAAGPITRISDLIVPEIFTPYTQVLTAEMSKFVNSGIVANDQYLSSLLSGAGTTYNMPAFDDLDNDEDRISSDTIPAGYTGGIADPDPKKIRTLAEKAIRLDRNQSWGASNLARDLIETDPMAAIQSRVANYWARRLDEVVRSTIMGVFADNAADPAGTEHVKDDLTVRITSNTLKPETQISGSSILDAVGTMGDVSTELTIMVVHSFVMMKLRKLNLIATVPTSQGNVGFETYLNRRIIETDNMPRNGGIYETWFFAPGVIRLGMASPLVPVEVERKPGAGNGGGAEVLYNRVVWSSHPVGHSYVGAETTGGPGNAVLAAATSWQRVYPERKQIKMARLISREA